MEAAGCPVKLVHGKHGAGSASNHLYGGRGTPDVIFTDMSRVLTASPPTVGGLAYLLPLAAAMLGCRVYSIGLATDGTVDSVGMGSSDSGGVGEATPVDAMDGPGIDLAAYWGDSGEPGDLAPVIVDPLIVGCSDGTREGFRDIVNWPNIAGCAGGWQWPGLIDPATRVPRCLRVAGNNSRNPEGFGCSATDLCARTWHGCLGGPDVASHSPTGGCESAVSPGDEALFVVMAGASPQGVCYPDPLAKNDLHGCGSMGIGQSESDGCPPLDRRMSFADCAATGVWLCGTSDHSLLEADVVTKSGPALGGVLCCKDPPPHD
jgi:hypothetical protein